MSSLLTGYGPGIQNPAKKLTSEKIKKKRNVTLKSKDVSHIVKFDGANSPFWKFKINLLLEQNSLLGIVDGTVACPPSKAEDESSNQHEVETWKQKDVCARSFLVRTIETQCQGTLMNCKTAADMWSRLTQEY